MPTLFVFPLVTSTPAIYTLSLHDALPICTGGTGRKERQGRGAGRRPVSRHHDHEFCQGDRKSTRLNSSHVSISYAVFCLKKKNNIRNPHNHNKVYNDGNYA